MDACLIHLFTIADKISQVIEHRLDRTTLATRASDLACNPVDVDRSLCAVRHPEDVAPQHMPIPALVRDEERQRLELSPHQVTARPRAKLRPTGECRVHASLRSGGWGQNRTAACASSVRSPTIRRPSQGPGARYCQGKVGVPGDGPETCTPGWLRGSDSNAHTKVQSLVSCHWTTPEMDRQKATRVFHPTTGAGLSAHGWNRTSDDCL